MLTGLTLIRWLHVMGAVLWVGGVAFVVLILRPALQKVAAFQVRRLILSQVVTRMRSVMNVVVTLQVITGTILAWLHLGGWAALVETPWGRLLLWKVVLAAVMIGIYVVVPHLLLPAPQQAAAAATAGHAAYECPTEQPGPRQKLGHLLHIVLLALGLSVIFLAKLLT